MGVNYNFSKGSDIPIWQWLPFAAGTSPVYHGCDNDYDGVRYEYWAFQIGTTATSASTTQLWRYDTWGQGWQYLATLTSGNRGLSLAYDDIRNVVIICHGSALTSWQVFNLNAAAVNICGVVCNPWVATTMTPVLPAAADYGATIATINPNAIPSIIENGSVVVGTTATTIIDTSTQSAFCDQMVGLELKMTSGLLNGQKRFITSITDANTLVLGSALGGVPAVGDTYVICLPDGTATAGSTVSTLVDSAATWTVNQYTNCDVVIKSGTGAGQKRRIASNTANTLTLATAVTGNTNTGNWTITPDATSVYVIQPSSDFLYYICGSTGTGLYKIDLATGLTAPAWVTLAVIPAVPSGGANIITPEKLGAMNLVIMRGNGTATFYQYNVGLNTFSTLAVLSGVETFTTGASSVDWHGQRKILIQKEGTVRVYALNLSTRQLEPFVTMPYAAPSAYDGHRMRVVTNADGTQWLYIQRAGGAEFFRVPLEWGTLV